MAVCKYFLPLSAISVASSPSENASTCITRQLNSFRPNGPPPDVPVGPPFIAGVMNTRPETGEGIHGHRLEIGSQARKFRA